jgi:hypothetical protein
MAKNCPDSCHKKTFREPSHRVISDDGQEEFYELSARDAKGKVLSMENFEGYVTVLVNAARVCGESRPHDVMPFVDTDTLTVDHFIYAHIAGLYERRLH